MKNFSLLTPTTAAKAFELLPDSFDDAARPRVLAGGQDLLGELKDHLVEADALVNIKRLPAMGVLEVGERGVSIGALVTMADLEEHAGLAAAHPVLTEAAASVASPQIRTQATLGGNLCQRPRCWYYRNEHTVCLKKGGDECFSYGGLSKYNAVLGGGPSYIVHPSDMAPALVALDASVSIAGAAGERELPLEEFFTLPTQGDVTRENVLGPNELVTGVRVAPSKNGWRSTYVKFRERGSFDWALSSVALALKMDGASVQDARLCLGGVAPVPWRCRSTERLLTGSRLDEATIERAAADALRGAEPLDDNAYKIPLTKALITKALRALSA